MEIFFIGVNHNKFLLGQIMANILEDVLFGLDSTGRYRYTHNLEKELVILKQIILGTPGEMQHREVVVQSDTGILAKTNVVLEVVSLVLVYDKTVAAIS